MEEAPLYLDFTFSQISSRFDLSRPEERMRVAELLGPRVLALEEPGEQDRYLTRLEELVGVSRRDLGAVLGVSRRDLLRSRRAAPAAGRASEGYVAPFIRARRDPLEEYTLALLLQDPLCASTAPGWRRPSSPARRTASSLRPGRTAIHLIG